MSNEIQFSYRSLATAYALIRNRVGQIWNSSGTGAFEAYTAGNYASYPVSCVEQGGSAFYAGNFPTAIVAGTYNLVAKEQIVGSPAQTDPTIAVGNFEWNGTATLPLSDLATSGQLGQIGPIRMAKGVALSGFPIKLVSSVDHITPFTSGVVSGQISRNGGSFGPLQSGTFIEFGLGWYKVNLTSGDLNADVVALVFSANGVSGGTADQRDIGLVLQKTSGN